MTAPQEDAECVRLHVRTHALRKSEMEGYTCEVELSFRVTFAEQAKQVLKRLNDDPFFVHVDIREDAIRILKERMAEDTQALRDELERTKRELEFAKHELTSYRGLQRS